MGNLHAFLHPAIVNEEKEVVISKRFLDEDGKPVKFRVRALTQEENEKLTKQATRVIKDRDGKHKDLDSAAYMNALVVAGTVYPDFSDSELCEHYGVLDPLMVPRRMLLAGEFSKLADAIADLSGINDGEEAAEEAKN